MGWLECVPHPHPRPASRGLSIHLRARFTQPIGKLGVGHWWLASSPLSSTIMVSGHLQCFRERNTQFMVTKAQVRRKGSSKSQAKVGSKGLKAIRGVGLSAPGLGPQALCHQNACWFSTTSWPWVEQRPGGRCKVGVGMSACKAGQCRT